MVHQVDKRRSPPGRRNQLQIDDVMHVSFEHKELDVRCALSFIPIVSCLDIFLVRTFRFFDLLSCSSFDTSAFLGRLNGIRLAFTDKTFEFLSFRYSGQAPCKIIFQWNQERSRGTRLILIYSMISRIRHEPQAYSLQSYVQPILAIIALETIRHILSTGTTLVSQHQRLSIPPSDGILPFLTEIHIIHRFQTHGHCCLIGYRTALSEVVSSLASWRSTLWMDGKRLLN